MMVRLEMAIPEALVDYHTTKKTAAKLARTITSQWTEFRSAWMCWLARHRLRRSIEHLDERLLADIGLDAEDLGLADRFTRRRAASLQNYWSLV
jgi:uncharacterized protein YjiS (DUF1127 family)